MIQSISKYLILLILFYFIKFEIWQLHWKIFRCLSVHTPLYCAVEIYSQYKSHTSMTGISATLLTDKKSVLQRCVGLHHKKGTATMLSLIKKFFRLSEHKTTVRQEVVAGFTTFVTMAYIIVVNPKILEAGGMPFGASMVATIISAFFGTLIMGVYARRPFAVAPYMGENAFIAFTVPGTCPRRL